MEVLTGISGFECKREKGDPKFYGVMNAKGESNFLYFLQQQLNKRRLITMNDSGSPVHIRIREWDGEPKKRNRFIKKRMHKDGHLVDDMQQYLRTEKPIMFRGKKCLVALYNNHWAIDGIEKDWNDGKCVLAVAFLEVEKKSKE
jgi:hypothetical protein